MSATLLTVTIAQTSSQPITEETVYAVLKHLSPVPSISISSGDKESVFTFTCENRRIAQKTFVVLTSNFSVVGKPDIREKQENQTLESANRVIEESKPKMIKLGFNAVDEMYSSGDVDNKPQSISGNSKPNSKHNSKFGSNAKKGSGYFSNYLNANYSQPKSQMLAYNSYKQFDAKTQPKSAILTRPVDSPLIKHSKQLEVPFVRVDNLDTTAIDSSILFNLLGIVGNVIKLLFNTKRGFAIVELEQVSQAELACQYLNDMPFFGNVLKVAIYEAGIDWSNLHIGSESDIRVISGNSKYYRYKPNLKIKVNKPSKLLHVTNVSADISLSSLCSLVSEICEPNLISKLESKGKKSNMYVIEFNSEKDSLEVLSTLHDKLVSGLRLKMSFSHMKMNSSIC